MKTRGLHFFPRLGICPSLVGVLVIILMMDRELSIGRHLATKHSCAYHPCIGSPCRFMHLACGLTDLGPVALHLALLALSFTRCPTQTSFGPEHEGM